MVLDGNKCVICRKFYCLSSSPLKGANRSCADVFSAWKSECATALCNVLFDRHFDYFVNYFENTNYCSGCEQLVRDISFTWKQVQLFQNRLGELSRNMCQMLDKNYQLIEKRSEPITVEQRISYLLDTTNSLKTPDYSYDEMMEIIYSVMSSGLGLSPYLQAKEVTNLNSSLSNDLKTNQNSFSSFGEEDILSKFDDDCKIKEELFDQEDDVCQASYSPNYNESGDQSEIKPENVYKNMEPIRNNTVENKILNHVPYDGESSNSSDQNANLIKKVERKIPPRRLKRGMKLKKKNVKTNKMYYCSEEDCHMRFTSQITKQIHVQKIHRGESKPYKCMQCLRRFTSSEHLKRHENNVHEKGRVLMAINCRFCGSKFIEPIDFTSHCSQFHQPPDQFRCAFCTEAHQNSIELTKHTKECHPQPNVCGICERVFTNESTLNSHHLKHHNGKNPWLQCPKCDRKFAIQSWLNTHMESHNESKLKCDQCEQQFQYSLQLKSHIKTKHEKGQFDCKVCGTILTTLYDLKTHRLTHQLNVAEKQIKGNTNSEERKSTLPNEISYTCHFCGKGYFKEEELQVHYATSHQAPTPFKCAFCPSIFNGSLILSRHRQTNHPDPHELKNRLKCKSCDLYFANKSSLSYHSKSHMDPKLLLKCHLCSAVFRKSHALEKHLEFHKDDSKYVCKICGKACSSQNTLLNHSLTHLKGNQGQNSTGKIMLDQEDFTKNNFNYEYECKFCSKGYITEEELNSHLAESHQGPNPFICAFCPAVYSNSVDLSQHQKSTHPDTNALAGNLKCNSCDRYFSNKQSLYVHSQSHRDRSLLLKCHLCPAVFIYNCDLKRHLETHRSEKFVCEICGKAYNRKQTLRYHSKTHNPNNRKYQCSMCCKKFFTSQHCKNHELTHTDMKEFVCQVCGKSFNRECNLSEHLKIHAGVPTRRRTKPKSIPNPGNQDNIV